MIKSVSLFIALVAASVAMVAAQSLKPDNPYPMKAGINRATSDSLVGIQYWYFYATPGNSRLTVRLKTPTTLYGAQLNTVIAVTLTDALPPRHRQGETPPIQGGDPNHPSTCSMISF